MKDVSVGGGSGEQARRREMLQMFPTAKNIRLRFQLDFVLTDIQTVGLAKSGLK